MNRPRDPTLLDFRHLLCDVWSLAYPRRLSLSLSLSLARARSLYSGGFEDDASQLDVAIIVVLKVMFPRIHFYVTQSDFIHLGWFFVKFWVVLGDV